MGIYVYMHTHMYEAKVAKKMADDAIPGGKRSSEESATSPAKMARHTDSEQIATPPSKQVTLASIMKRQGSPAEIIRNTSLGAKPRASLLEVLQSQKIEEQAKKDPESFVEGVAGEDHQAKEVKHGSRDRSQRS